ncbi:MAG: DUF4386 family protein [Tahibacter sp.]
MKTELGTARVIAALFLLQGVGGPIVNFVLLAPAMKTPPGFLANASAHAMNIGWAVMIGLLTSAMSIGVAIAGWRVFSRHSKSMSIWLVVLATAGFVLTGVEQISILSMLSLSQAFVAAGSADVDRWQTASVVVGSIRHWAHYMNLIAVCGTLCVFYGLLLRFSLVARALAAFGLAAALLMLVAVAMPVFGAPIRFALLAPLGVAQLALAVWLIAKGFQTPTHADPAGMAATGVHE